MSIGKLKSKEIQSTAHAPLNRVIQSTNFDYKPQCGVENIQAEAYNGARSVVLNFTFEFTLLCTKLSMCYMCALLLYIRVSSLQDTKFPQSQPE